MQVGFFFGAGAEIGYGLPSGGKFAIDIFRKDASNYKTELRENLASIDGRSAYAVNWLPQGYLNKRIHAFGRNEFTTLIESSVEYRRSEIIRRLNQFDVECDQAINDLGIDVDLPRRKFQEFTGEIFGDRLYTNEIRLNPILAQEVRLFGSEYYSAMLDLVRRNQQTDDLKRYATSFVQLLVGAHGQDLVQKLNQELFEEAPDDLPIFDDISGMFKLEFSRVGATALELLLEEQREFAAGDDATATTIFCAIAQRVMENIFTTVLDYQKLIDDHFRYLFSPTTEWAKFTKMVVFLKIARDYISQQVPNLAGIRREGYYHDLENIVNEGHQISTIGTANYNSILSYVAQENSINIPDVIHLNGSTSDYYNPYKNSVVTYRNNDDIPVEQLHVPFILTQSGLKPLTSVAMSRRYVDLFDKFSNSDAVVVIGFGFNKDDSHINGLFRELIEIHRKPVYWVCRVNDGAADAQQRDLMKKLRLSHEFRSYVRVVPVDTETRCINEVAWSSHIISELLRDNQE